MKSAGKQFRKCTFKESEGWRKQDYNINTDILTTKETVVVDKLYRYNKGEH